MKQIVIILKKGNILTYLTFFDNRPESFTPLSETRLRDKELWDPGYTKLQNSPYFCVFKYPWAVKQKVSNKAENRERDWRETFFFLSHVRLLRHALPISLLILRKKPTVLQSKVIPQKNIPF